MRDLGVYLERRVKNWETVREYLGEVGLSTWEKYSWSACGRRGLGLKYLGEVGFEYRGEVGLELLGEVGLSTWEKEGRSACGRRGMGLE